MNRATSLKKVGKKVEAFRKAKKLSVETYAKHCTMKSDQLKRIECGEVNLRFETLVRIAISLQEDLNELL